MDLAALALLVDPRGGRSWRRCPPYDERSELRLQDRLREAGYAPELVAAALTQPRLRARARRQVRRRSPTACSSPPTGSSRRPGSRSRRATRRGTCAPGSRRSTTSAAASARTPWPSPALDLTVRAVDADAVTAAVAAVNLRHWPAAQVGRTAAPRTSALPTGEAPRIGVWLDPARRVRRARPTRADASSGSSRSTGSRRPGRRCRGRGAGAGHRGQAGAGVPARGRPARRRGAVDVVARRGLECAVWWGPLVETAGRTAPVLRPGSDADRRSTEADAAAAEPPLAVGGRGRRSGSTSRTGR